MVIYSHNLHEKLFGYAISREFIKYQTPFCDLLDDPDLALDFDLAIKFNQAINSSPTNLTPATNFTNTLVLCSTNLDVTSLNFYRHKMKTYPIFASEIARINFTFANLNRLPSDNGGFVDSLKNAVKSCLDSPCNLFNETSDTVGKLSQGTLFATNGTTLPIGDLKDSFSTFAGGISTTLFNKVPNIIQTSITSLKFIGKQAWSESMTMLAGDSLPDLVAKAQSGTSLRTSTAGYRYTPDLKSFLDLSEVAPDILGGIAADMGDCFRRYQQSARYNPYDPAQNLSDVAKSPVADQVNGSTFYRNIIGQPDGSNTGGRNRENLTVPGKGNKQSEPSTSPKTPSISNIITSPVASVIPIPSVIPKIPSVATAPSAPATPSATSIPVTPGADSIVTPVYDFRSPGKGGDGEITVYTALLENNKFITDSTTDSNTEAGKSAFPKNIPFIPPNSYSAYTKLINEGKTNNTDLTKIDKNKINNGFAMNLDNLARLIGNNYSSATIRQIMNGNQSDKWIYAEITPSSGPKQIVQLIDTNVAKGSSTAIDLTVYAWNKTFTKAILPTPDQKPVEYSTEGENTAIYSYNSAPNVSAKVRFIVGKPSDVGGNTNDCDKKAQDELDLLTQSTAAEMESLTKFRPNINSATIESYKLFTSAVESWKSETDPNTKYCLMLLIRETAIVFLKTAHIEWTTVSTDEVLVKIGKVPSETPPETRVAVTGIIQGFADNSKQTIAAINRLPTDCGEGIQC